MRERESERVSESVRENDREEKGASDGHFNSKLISISLIKQEKY